MPELDDQQQAWIDGLRALADFAEVNPDAISVYATFQVDVFADDAADMARLAKSIGVPFEKTSSDTWYSLRKRFGPHTIQVTSARENVCEQVLVGTKTVQKPDPDLLAAVPTVTVAEPVFEWKCPDSILAAAS